MCLMHSLNCTYKMNKKNIKRILSELRMTIEELEAEVLSDPSSYKLDVDYQDVLDYEDYQDTAEEGL